MINFLKPPLELRRGFKNPKRLGYVAQYCCIRCETLGLKQKTRLNVHHLAGIGAGLKASDLLTFPLCELCHAFFHAGIERFEKDFKTQKECIRIINERIFKDNILIGKDLYFYELVRDWAAN